MSLPASNPQRRLSAKIVVMAIAAGAVAGFAYNAVIEPHNTAASWTRGILTGMTISGLVAAYEVGLRRRGGRGPRLRLPLLPFLLMQSIVYAAIIVLALAGGALLFPTTVDAGDGSYGVSTRAVVFSLGMSVLGNGIMELARLLGPRVLLALLTGRYYRARREERVILFIDMMGSTGAGEALGDEAFHRLLSRFFGNLEEAVLAARGEIYKFVGDEVIVTWPAAEGLAHGRCLMAVREAARRLAEDAEEYRREFGFTPTFRAGLHVGTVIAGEVGAFRREIAFVGDAVNTASRLVDTARERGEMVVISADLAARLPAEHRAGLRPLGSASLRGRQEMIEVLAA